MAGMQFEYDEKGGIFYYFLLSFVTLVLLPSTYYFWPRSESKEDDSKQRKCNCEQCQIKRSRLKASGAWSRNKQKIVKIVLLIGWVILILLAYKVSTIEIDFVEYDPYVVLEIDRGATTREIKKAYRTLSLKYHPDKETGDPKKFMRIAKAYAALTDEESRKNWEEYGNPDGPGATQFGIALPKWIVEKENSVWVLALYGLAFIVILPIIVGTWWYRSIKFSADQILLDTSQMYLYFFHKTPNMILRRVIMILSASFEFEKGHNHEIIERPTDNEELPPLIKDLGNIQEKNKEKPLCFPYSVKARTLLHAHYSRVELPPKTLEEDKNYILKKSPYLINEMVNTVAQLVALGHAGKIQHIPRLETVEHCMKVSQMLIQGLWDNKSPLLQLPHISEDMLKHFVTRKRNIRNINQFIAMSEEDRRSLLRTLNDNEYRDILAVCAKMPSLKMSIQSEVIDEEDNSITAGSIVTVTVRLVRQNLEELFAIENENEDDVEEEEDVDSKDGGQGDQGDEDAESKENEVSVTDSPSNKQKQATLKPWEKQQKKKRGGKAAKSKKKPAKQPYNYKAKASTTPGKDSEEVTQENGRIEDINKKSKKKKPSDNEGSDMESGSESEESDDDSVTDDNRKDSKADRHSDDEDEQEWMKQFKEQTRKENTLEAKSKESHTVHCPYFPVDKQEWWWLYVADRKNHLLITAPVQVCSLKYEDEIQLKFTAPKKIGIHQYTVHLRSDSYMDFDIMQNIKLDVKEAKKIEDHPQWDISDDEEKDHEDEDSDDTTDYDDSEEDE